MIIGFSATNAIMSKIIKCFTKSRASHSYILIDIAGEPIVIHSNSHGVNCDHYKVFKKQKKVVVEYRLLVTEEHERIAIGAALRLLDRPYDFLSLVGFGWVLLNKAFGRQTKNPFPNRSAYQCSEFALEVLKEAGIKGLDHMDRELVSPEDLIKFLDNHSDAEKI